MVRTLQHARDLRRMLMQDGCGACQVGNHAESRLEREQLTVDAEAPAVDAGEGVDVVFEALH